MELKGGSSGPDSRLVTTFVCVGAVGVVLTVVSSGVTGLAFAGAGAGAAAVAVSVGAGASLALSNLYALSRVVAALAVPDPSRSQPAPDHEESRTSRAGLAWGVFALGKTMLLFGSVWFLMTRHLVDPIPMVVGYGALPIGIAIGAVVSDKTGRRDRA